MLAALAALAAASVVVHPPADDRPARGFIFEELTLSGRTYRYVVYVPRDYDAEKKWPVILFLHGAGECGSDGLKPVAQGIGQAVLWDPTRWPFLIVIPQKPEVRDAWEDHDEAVMAMLDNVIKKYSVDENRQYLTGLSQGGHGTWVLGARHASRWAAIAPICGYGKPAEIAPALKDMPIWCFHGDADKAVPLEKSQQIVDAIKAQGGQPRFTVYPGVGHNSWDKAYREEPLPAWFLSHTRQPQALEGKKP